MLDPFDHREVPGVVVERSSVYENHENLCTYFKVFVFPGTAKAVASFPPFGRPGILTVNAGLPEPVPWSLVDVELVSGAVGSVPVSW